MNIKFATVLAVVVALLSGWLLVTVAKTMPEPEVDTIRPPVEAVTVEYNEDSSVAAVEVALTFSYANMFE